LSSINSYYIPGVYRLQLFGGYGFMGRSRASTATPVCCVSMRVTTGYRIHSTNAPETIGQAVSSGCFRLVNEDVQDLFSRVPVGTSVIVQHQ
jgi:L,D-transpeptidase-like protein